MVGWASIKMKTEIKAKNYLTNNKVFPILNNGFTEIWGVEGSNIWTVKYSNGMYVCSCPNIKPVECSHIKAVKIKRGELVE